MDNSPRIHYKITPAGPLRGEIAVPGDKSISHRALILSAIALGRTKINGFLMGADNLALVNAFQQMGVAIECIENKNILCIEGVGFTGLQAPSQALNLGNSGTALRLLTGLLAGQLFDTVLTGDESLCKRPMRRIVDPLRLMGAKIAMAEQDTPPLKISGRQALLGITYELPIASAQVKSCLLLAGLYARGKTCIVESEITRDHTEQLLKQFGYPISQEKNKENLYVCLSGYPTTGIVLTGTDITVPGDISSAAFFIIAALITPASCVTLVSVGLNPTRTGIIDILNLMGANIIIKNTRDWNGEKVGDIVVGYSPLHGIEIPEKYVSSAIDELPVLLIAAAVATGKTILRGAAELRVKESDRIGSMAVGLKQLGIETEMLPDGIIVHPGLLQGGEVESFGDHRIAMAFAIAGNITKTPVIVRNCNNIQTSFPDFPQLAETAGMKIEMM